MSSKITPVLYLAPYEQVERKVPKLPYRMLPGRMALMQHPILASESGVLVTAGRNFAVWVCNDCGEASRRAPQRCENCGGFNLEEVRKNIGEADSGHLEPDVCVVACSAIGCFTPGDVLLVKPEAGARIEAPQGGWDGWDTRDVRMLGLPGMPWQDRVMARLSEKGIAPLPGWSLVERDLVKMGPLEVKEAYEPYGTCLSGEGDGERLVWGERDEVWDLRGADKSWALVKFQKSLVGFAKTG